MWYLVVLDIVPLSVIGTLKLDENFTVVSSLLVSDLQMFRFDFFISISRFHIPLILEELRFGS